MNENSLNNKLNRVEMVTKDLRAKLKLDDSSVIEDVVEATNLAALANVFVQENEPNIKDGIWIQANKEENPWDKIKMDREMIVPYKWLLQEKTNRLTQRYNRNSENSLTMPTSARAVCFTNGFLTTSYRGACVFDIANNSTVGQHPDYNRKYYNRDCCVATDTDVFFAGYTSGYGMIRFQIGTHTSSGGTPSWDFPTHMVYCPYNRSIYAIYSESVKGPAGLGLGCWNVDTGVKTTIINPYSYSGSNLPEKYNMLVPLGNRLLVIGIKPEDSFMLDLDTNKPATDEPAIVKTIYLNDPTSEYNLLDMADCFYIYKGIEHVVKYNKDTLESEDITYLFQDKDVEKCFFMFYYNDRIYMVTGPNKTEVYVMPMQMEGKSYNDNCVLISQAPISRTEYQTAL